MSVSRLFHNELEGERGLGIVLNHINISRCGRAFMCNGSDFDESCIAQLAALEETFEIDTELPSFEDIRSLWQTLGTTVYTGQRCLLEPFTELWFNEDIEFLEHDLGLRGERRIIGEEIDREVIIGP